MVYESDFYTTRRPYSSRATPSLSSYTITGVPSRQVRVLPGIGKVHVVHTYDRIVPYVGHKRLTVVSPSAHVVHVRPSVLVREFDRIENKVRPWVSYSATNNYLNSDSAVNLLYETPLYGKKIKKYRRTPFEAFDDESRLIKAQSRALMTRIHSPVPREYISSWPISTISRYDDGLRVMADNYIHRLTSPARNNKLEITTYYTEPVKKYFGSSKPNLSCVSYMGNRAYPKRRQLSPSSEDVIRNDINLLSYYITSFRAQKILHEQMRPKVYLSPLRPTRIFNVPKLMNDPADDIKEVDSDRATRRAKIYEITDEPSKPKADAEDAAAKAAMRRKEEARLAEEKVLAEEAAKKEAQAKKDEAARRAELERQEKLAAEAAAERAAELEKRAEQARQEELAKQAEQERKNEEERLAKIEAEKAEKARIEAEKAEQARIEAEKAEQARIEEEKRQEEERQQLLRLEEIARQAEEEKEAELARQAAELAELARQEAELAEKAKKEADEQARLEAEAAELARQEAELAELERQAQELDALDAAAKALESDAPAADESSPAEEPAEPEPIVEEPATPEAAAPAAEEAVEEEEEEE